MDGADLGKMARETFELGTQVDWSEQDGHYKCGEQDYLQFSFKDIETLLTYPQRPGVLFSLKVYGDTFAVLGEATPNIQSLIAFLIRHKLVEKTFKVPFDQGPPLSWLQKIDYVETHSERSAKAIAGLILGKNFNFSSSKDIWWASFEQGEIRILFTRPKNFVYEGQIPLGPLGGRERLISLMSAMEGSLIGKEEARESFESTEQGEFFVIKGNGILFTHLQKLLLLGEFEEELEKKLLQMGDEIVSLVEEYADLRKFWCEFENKVQVGLDA